MEDPALAATIFSAPWRDMRQQLNNAHCRHRGAQHALQDRRTEHTEAELINLSDGVQLLLRDRFHSRPPVCRSAAVG
jgi:hypothetical protein